MNILFLCKTPYHIMVATQIALTKHEGDTFDIVLFNTMSNVEKMENNIKKSGFFDTSRICYMCKIDRPAKNVFRRICSKCCIFGMGLAEWFRNPSKKTYDYIYTSAACWVDKQIILNNKKRAKKKRINTREYLYEDGVITYCKKNQNRYKKAFGLKEKLERVMYNIKIYHNYSGMYVFSPELMEWTPTLPVYPIEKIANSDQKYMKVINSIFQYHKMEDTYDRRYIFFEESYYADGVDINDLDVINGISQIVKSENLFVKIHPRNKDNRFSEMKVKTNRNTVIPWEIIALNEKLIDKTLITITSSSAINILLITKIIPRKIILLFEYDKINKDKLLPMLEFERKVYNQYKDIISLPKNSNELANCLLN